jgi:hypothetical protein
MPVEQIQLAVLENDLVVRLRDAKAFAGERTKTTSMPPRKCTPAQIQRCVSKVSDPLLDRIDIPCREISRTIE